MGSSAPASPSVKPRERSSSSASSTGTDELSPSVYRRVCSVSRAYSRSRTAPSSAAVRGPVTIASLIEKETDGSDHAKIASVIYNRLNDSGSHGTYRMLNIDAALLYALPDHEGALTNADKKVDSPYNLYTHAGLPPTPIATPGIASIDAALRPETTDYYYYALGKDGKHHFSTTLSEHNAFLNSGEYGG